MKMHTLLPNIEQYCPELLSEFLELQKLSSRDGLPVIAAFGQYNVGKSSLLNTLIGSPIFAVADKRQTTENQCHEAHEICWLDTPGLDADTSSDDDKYAHEALQKADMVLFLHNLANGELDNRQINWIHKLSAQRTGPDILLIMTRIDECSQEHIAQTVNKIQHQVGNFPIFQISSQRYMNGLAAKQARLQELSGIPDLLTLLYKWREQLSVNRAKKLAQKQRDLQQILSQNLRVAKHELTLLEQQQVIRENALRTDLLVLHQRATQLLAAI